MPNAWPNEAGRDAPTGLAFTDAQRFTQPDCVQVQPMRVLPQRVRVLTQPAHVKADGYGFGEWAWSGPHDRRALARLYVPQRGMRT